MNDLLLDLATAAPWLVRHPRRPPAALSAVRCDPLSNGLVIFKWQPPPGRVPVDGYLVERTRDGRDYEVIGRPVTLGFVMGSPALNEPWFYRATAFNARGQGPAELVFFYLRRERNSMFLRVPVRPGLQVVINEFLPA